MKRFVAGTVKIDGPVRGDLDRGCSPPLGVDYSPVGRCLLQYVFGPEYPVVPKDRARSDSAREATFRPIGDCIPHRCGSYNPADGEARISRSAATAR